MSMIAIDRVEKPWGYEFRVALGTSLTLTYLTIFPKSQTSLHCHPRKTTSLTAISGSGTIRFLKDSIKFAAGTSFMVRNGLFHQISNTSTRNLVVLEFENPSDPMDLVRLEDSYGRRLTHYESTSKENFLTETEKDFFQKITLGGIWSNNETVVRTLEPTRFAFNFDEDAVYAVLQGGLRDNISGSLVLREGDCTTTSTIVRLIDHFGWDIPTKLLEIKRKIDN